jgi:hypothetical protein
LNRARARLSSINRKIHSRRLKIFQGFKAYIPQLDEKYSKLEELAELHDLHEFDSLFKSTYPEVFRWQNQFRTSRKPKKELTDRINEDMQEITRLNSEISKKLGTMLRELEQNYQSLLTQENKQKLDRMARQQGQMKKSTDKLSQTFEKMNRENPMIGNQLSNKMKGTGEYINKAEQNLKQHNIPDSIESENKVLSELAEAREFLKQLKDVNQAQSKSKSDKQTLKLGTGRAKDKRKGGSVRMQKERVTLPSEDQYRVPGQFREDILKAMKKKFPKDYERMVMEYYKELVK